MPCVRFRLTSLHDRRFLDTICAACIAAGQTAMLVRRDDEAEPGNNLPVLRVFIELAEYANDVLPLLELDLLHIELVHGCAHVALALNVYCVIEFNRVHVLTVHEGHLLDWVLH